MRLLIQEQRDALLSYDILEPRNYKTRTTEQLDAASVILVSHRCERLMNQGYMPGYYLYDGPPLWWTDNYGHWGQGEEQVRSRARLGFAFELEQAAWAAACDLGNRGWRRLLAVCRRRLGKERPDMAHPLVTRPRRRQPQRMPAKAAAADARVTLDQIERGCTSRGRSCSDREVCHRRAFDSWRCGAHLLHRVVTRDLDGVMILTRITTVRRAKRSSANAGSRRVHFASR